MTARIKLRHYAGGSWYLGEHIRTPATEDDTMYLLDVMKAPGSPPELTLSSPYGPCPRMSVKVDSTRDTIRASIPATCLGSPKWVRLGLVYMKFARQGMYLDDSMRKGVTNINGEPGATPRIYRG